MTQTNASAAVDLITDTENGLMIVEVGVGFPEGNVYPMTLSPTLPDGKALPVITITDSGDDCANSGFEIVFEGLPNREGEVRLNFVLPAGWEFQPYPFTANGNTQDIRWGWTNPNNAEQAFIDVFNLSANEWLVHFDLQLIDPSKNRQTVDPKLIGRRG